MPSGATMMHDRRGAWSTYNLLKSSVVVLSVDQIPVLNDYVRSCRTNFPKEIMSFPDFSFDVELPSFPHHSDVLSYLHQYADRYNLHQFIQFNCSVESVTPIQVCSCSGDHTNKEDGYCARAPHQGDILKERACMQII